MIDDYPIFCNETRPIARKKHTCCECNVVIPKGIKYCRLSGKWDREVKSFTLHEECWSLKYDFEQINEEPVGFGESFGLAEEHRLKEIVKGYKSVQRKYREINRKNTLKTSTEV